MFTGFDVTGDVVDDFFSPSRYFFERAKSNVKSEGDLVYNSEIADEWEIIFEKQRIIIIFKCSAGGEIHRLLFFCLKVSFYY